MKSKIISRDKTIIIFPFVVLAFILFNCAGPRVSHYEESHITSISWAGDSLIAFSKHTEKGFISKGVKYNPKFSSGLWIAKIEPKTGKIDTTFEIMKITGNLGNVQFFPGGDELLIGEKDGVWRVNLSTGKRVPFFTHYSFNKPAISIDIGPDDRYTAIVIDVEGFPGTEKWLDLFVIETRTGTMVFSTDSLIDERSFAWSASDKIEFIIPDRWNLEKNKVVQFDISDNISKPSNFSEEEVRKNNPTPEISSSGRWRAIDRKGQLAIVPAKE